MRTHLRIGRLFGVPIGINWSVLIVGVLLTVSLAKLSLPTAAPNHAESSYWFAGILGLIGFMVSLVGHETGHSYIAGRNNVKVAEITLWLFGGVAKLEREADDPGAEFRIAAAGPAMNFVLAAVFGLGFWLASHWDASDVLLTLLVWLCAVNIVLAVSNLLPAFPLDGGQMLRAVLWRRSGRKVTATRKAALLGQIFGIGLVVLSIGIAIWWSRWSGLWGLIMGMFIFIPARAGWKASGPQPELLEWSVGGLGRRLPRPMMCTATIAELERTLSDNPGVPLIPVFDDHGQVASLVMPDAVLRVPPAQRGLVPISSFLEPIYSLPRVHPSESISAVLARLGHGMSWRAVVSDGTSVEGVLCSEDVAEIVDLATA
ncbi:MAG: site-2 protease family protein [Microthrixaceae bacterium]